MEVVVGGPREEAEEHVHLGAEEEVKAAVRWYRWAAEVEECWRFHSRDRSVVPPFERDVMFVALKSPWEITSKLKT